MENLALGIAAPGNAYLAFQQAVMDQYDKGVILAINSRNNPEDAWQVIRTHPNMLLRENHFAAVRMNWNDKAQNIRELAEELNIGLDSMVFIDDDPTNRALVRALVPEVETPELPADPAEYVRFLNSADYFPATASTDEDRMRGNLYVTERIRREEEKRHITREDFLSELGLTLTVHRNDPATAARVAQLTKKTNQFNAYKEALSEEQMKVLMNDPQYEVLYGRLQDKFGDYGIVTVAIVYKAESEWSIQQLLMSCRALGRSVEDAFMSLILDEARAAGVEHVSIRFKETSKNAPAKEFIERKFDKFQRPLTRDFAMPSWVTTTYAHI